MNKESQSFLYKLLETPSPTGSEQKIQRLVRQRMKKYSSSIKTDYHGNVIVGINTKAKRRIMLAGHCDQIGFMVTHITDKGYIYVSPLGGIDGGTLPGAAVTVHGKNGPIAGVIGRKPIHKQSPEERAKGKIDVQKVWIDIGAKSGKEVERMVQIGDTVTYQLGVTELLNGNISSPGLDDKAGLFVVMEALRICSRAKLDVALYAVSTVQEEVGLRGARTAAYGIDPEIGIGVDVTFATDNPGKGEGKDVPVKLAGGPVIVRGPNINPVIEKMLTAAAKKAKIPHQFEPSTRPLGNDANALQITRAGVATGSVEIPNRYMHSQVEVCNLKDLVNSAKLLAGFVRSVGAKTSLIPR